MSYGQSRKWGVWNAYNRRDIILKGGDSTASWTYGTATVRASNADSNNKITIFSGLADGQFRSSFRQKWAISSAANSVLQVAIGYNSTTAVSGFGPESGNNNVSGGANLSVGMTHQAEYNAALSIGINNLQSLEKGTTGTGTFYGT